MSSKDRNLPREAIAKLTRLSIAANSADTTTRGLTTQIAELQHSITLNPENRDAVAMQLEELQNARRSGAESRRSLVDLVGNLNSWVREWQAGLTGVGYVEASAPSAMRPHKGEPPGAAIRRIRIQIEDIKRELYLTSIAVLPNGAYQEAARHYVSRLARQVAPSVTVDKQGLFRVNFHVGDVGGLSSTHVFAVLAWAFPDHIADRLCERIEQLPRNPNVPQLTIAEKEQKLAELHVKLFELERGEEQLILMTEQLGQPVGRRPDADPMAVLGLRPAVRKPDKKANGHARQSEPRVRLHAKDPRSAPAHAAAKRKLLEQQRALDDDAATEVEMGRAR